MKTNKNLDNIYEKSKADSLSLEETLKVIEDFSWEKLSYISNRLRKDRFGDKIKLCTIINVKSGSCDMNCSFCSQSSSARTDIDNYSLITENELHKGIEFSKSNKANNCGLVASGGKMISDDIYTLTNNLNKMETNSICASFGRLKKEELEYLKGSGITRIHHNLETSKNYYKNICTTQTWESRVATVKEALDQGLKVCSGGLFGLGESWRDRVELALTLKELGVDSIPINFLNPQKGTKLENQKILSSDEALKIISIFRILLPNTTLRICGGRTTVLKEKQHLIFKAGANALMTGNYLTTTGNTPINDIKMIQNEGLSTV